MKWPYKVFVIVFLLFQSSAILGLLPNKVQHSSYTTEVMMEVFFSISKINNLYNFFTDPENTGKYTYSTNNIYMLRQQNGKLEKLPISSNGSLKNITLPINYARINNIPSISTRDTLFYSAAVRAEALYFLKRNYTYPLIYFEVLSHRCSAERSNNTFVKREKVDTVYTNYFAFY